MPENSPLAGFARLATLKAQALPALPADNAQFDAIISRIGFAVAAVFDLRARRKFARKVDDVCSPFGADATFVCLPRYPIEAVSAIESLAYGDVFPDTGLPRWVDYSNQFVTTLDADAGLIYFGSAWGATLDRVRVKYTGGYFIPDDAGVASTMPEGATPFPDDLLQMFFLQCASQFDTQDILGVGAVRDEKTPTASTLPGGGLLPLVAQVVDNYARLA